MDVPPGVCEQSGADEQTGDTFAQHCHPDCNQHDGGHRERLERHPPSRPDPSPREAEHGPHEMNGAALPGAGMELPPGATFEPNPQGRAQPSEAKGKHAS